MIDTGVWSSSAPVVTVRVSVPAPVASQPSVSPRPTAHCTSSCRRHRQVDGQGRLLDVLQPPGGDQLPVELALPVDVLARLDRVVHRVLDDVGVLAQPERLGRRADLDVREAAVLLLELLERLLLPVPGDRHVVRRAAGARGGRVGAVEEPEDPVLGEQAVEGQRLGDVDVAVGVEHEVGLVVGDRRGSFSDPESSPVFQKSALAKRAAIRMPRLITMTTTRFMARTLGAPATRDRRIRAQPRRSIQTSSAMPASAASPCFQ